MRHTADRPGARARFAATGCDLKGANLEGRCPNSRGRRLGPVSDEYVTRSLWCPADRVMLDETWLGFACVWSAWPPSQVRRAQTRSRACAPRFTPPTRCGLGQDRLPAARVTRSEWPETLRVVRHLPATPLSSPSLVPPGGQASDKPRGRNPREELVGSYEAVSYGD